MAVRSSALGARCPSPPRRFLALVSVRDLVDLIALVRLTGLGQLKKELPLIILKSERYSLVYLFVNALFNDVYMRRPTVWSVAF
jgi:hypothetical protein